MHFSPSYHESEILDGKVITHLGYGWGSSAKTWTALEGFKVLRVCCMFFGVEQPKNLKGEKKSIKLSELLVELSNYNLNIKSLSHWSSPWKNLK